MPAYRYAIPVSAEFPRDGENFHFFCHVRLISFVALVCAALLSFSSLPVSLLIPALRGQSQNFHFTSHFHGFSAVFLGFPVPRAVVIQ